MKIFAFASCLLLITAWFPSRAQSYQVGYFVNSLGDTVRGFIEVGTREKLSNQFGYKRTLSASASSVSANSARSFGYKGVEAYRSYRHPDRSDQSHMFFRVEIPGRITLFRDGLLYYGATSDGRFFRLTPIKIKTDPPHLPNNPFHGDFYKMDYSGMGILKFEMRDCPKAVKAIDHGMHASNPSFPSYFKMYNQCLNAKAGKTPAK